MFLPSLGNFFQPRKINSPFQGSKANLVPPSSSTFAEPLTKFFIETGFTIEVFIFLVANWNQAPSPGRKVTTRHFSPPAPGINYFESNATG